MLDGAESKQIMEVYCPPWCILALVCSLFDDVTIYLPCAYSSQCQILNLCVYILFMEVTNKVTDIIDIKDNGHLEKKGEKY